ncbi:MAG TPA: HEAT repeat domain-containing protein, partial [Chthoniobacteraceae bacterium]
MATRHKFPAFAVGTFLSIYPFFFTAAEPGETPIAPELENRVEPTYKGRTLASWLGDLGNKPAGPEYQPAADAIRQMGAATIPYLLRALEQADAFPEKADHAVNAFRELGVQAKDATPKLSELLSKESSSSFAANALVALGADAPVIELMAQSNRQLRKNAIVALGSYGANAEAVPELVPLLRDKDDELRALTAWALGAISKEDEKCVPALARSLDDQTAWVRANAATALSNFKSERNISLPALIHSTADKDESVRDSAISSLRRLF